MDSTLISTRPDEGTLSLSRARRAALGSFAGAVVDWYDFLLYGITAALVFNREFFPQVSPAMGTLAAFATFGVGFLFRPLGGVIFGHFGDRLGRKRMLMLTVWMMGIATALIGILPSFSTIGWWAPILLVTLRAIQGFAVGGEWGGAALLSVESAPKNKKAFYSSGVQVGYGVGLLLSTGLVSLISMMTTDEQFLSWGWRIPFLFSIVLVLGALWVRNGMGSSCLPTTHVMWMNSFVGDAARSSILIVPTLPFLVLAGTGSLPKPKRQKKPFPTLHGKNTRCQHGI